MISKPKDIEPLKYYIVDTHRFLEEPKMLWNVYDTEDEALYAIEKKLSFNLKRYVPCKGLKAIRHGLRFFWDLGAEKARHKFPITHYVRNYKYDYPDNRVPGQNRKTYRTIMRRKQKKLEKPT